MSERGPKHGDCNRCWECGRPVAGAVCSRKHPNFDFDRAIILGNVEYVKGDNFWADL